jgi:hypothetical protein
VYSCQSSWGWHSFPNKNNFQFKETLQDFNLNGKVIPYSIQTSNSVRTKEAVEYFRVNPHRLQLGQIGMILIKQNGEKATISDVKNINQTLDLWKGIINSHFTLEGIPVDVQTMIHPDESPLVVNKTVKRKTVQASIWASSEHPLSIGTFLPLLNVLSFSSKQVRKLSKYLT